MRLKYWPVLCLFFLIPLLHRWWLHRNRPPRIVFPLPIPPSLHRRDRIKWILLLKYIGLGFLWIALARPQRGFHQAERRVSGVDIMMALDVSASMNIEDLADRPRIEVAKDTMARFVRARRSDRIGFVMFSGEPFTWVPPTLDEALLLQSLKGASIGVLKDGTAIGDGLALSVSHLRNSRAKSRVIILLTDGDNNLGQVDPVTAGELAAGYGIRVYTIAIGREGRVKMPVKHQGLFGNTVTTYQWFENALNPTLLQKVAEITRGKFYRVTDASALDAVFKEIDQLEKTDIQVREMLRYEDLFSIPLMIGFILFAIAQILEKLIWRILV